MMIPGLFEYFSEKILLKNFLDEGATFASPILVLAKDSSLGHNILIGHATYWVGVLWTIK